MFITPKKMGAFEPNEVTKERPHENEGNLARAEKISEARESAGVSREKLGDATDFPEEVIDAIERGGIWIGDGLVRRIGYALGVDPTRMEPPEKPLAPVESPMGSIERVVTSGQGVGRMEMVERYSTTGDRTLAIRIPGQDELRFQDSYGRFFVEKIFRALMRAEANGHARARNELKTFLDRGAI